MNKLGQGGFGPVYKVTLDFKGLTHFFNNIGILKSNKVVLYGTFVDGQEVEVKILSRRSGQGLENLKMKSYKSRTQESC